MRVAAVLAAAGLPFAAAGEPLRTLDGHTLPVQAVAYSSGGDTVLTGGLDGTARVWDAETGEPLATVEHGAWVWSAGFSPDGERFLTSGEDGVVRIWETGTGALLRSFAGHGAAVYAAAFSPDGTRVASGGADNRVILWEAESGAPIRSFEGHEGWVRTVAFSPDGTTLLSGGSDETARLWETETGRLLVDFTRHTGAVVSGAFAPGGGTVVTGSLDGTARVWTTADAGEVRRFEDPAIHSVAFAPHDWKVLTGSQGGTARLWDMRTGAELRSYENHGGPVAAAAFSPDGLRVLTGSGDGRARVWNTYTAALALRISGDFDFGRVVAGESREQTFTVRNLLHVPVTIDPVAVPDGFSLAGGGMTIPSRVTREFRLVFRPRIDREYSGELALRTDRTTGVHGAPVSGLGVIFEPKTTFVAESATSIRTSAFSSDGRFLATGYTDGEVQVRDVRDGELLRLFEGTGAAVESLDVSADSTRLLAASGGVARILDIESGALLQQFDGADGPVQRAVFSPDGSRVLSSERFRARAVLWDAETLEILHRFAGPGSWFSALAFFPDGTRMLIGSDNGTVRLWDAETGQSLGDFSGHGSRVTDLALFPDGSRLLTTSTDRTVRLWDVATRTTLRTYDQEMGIVWALDLSPDGTRFLTGSIGAPFRLRAIETGEILRDFHKEGAGAGGIAFVGGGNEVATIEFPGAVRLWETVIRPPVTYETWAASIEPEGARRPEAAPFGDGVPNLVRYALGRERHERRPLITFRGEPGSGAGPTATLERRARRGDVTLHLEVSGDLESWVTAAVADGLGPFFTTGDGPVEVTRDLATSTVTVTRVPADSGSLFVRLRAVPLEGEEY